MFRNKYFEQFSFRTLNPEPWLVGILEGLTYISLFLSVVVSKVRSIGPSYGLSGFLKGDSRDPYNRMTFYMVSCNVWGVRPGVKGFMVCHQVGFEVQSVGSRVY